MNKIKNKYKKYKKYIKYYFNINLNLFKIILLN